MHAVGERDKASRNRAPLIRRRRQTNTQTGTIRRRIRVAEIKLRPPFHFHFFSLANEQGARPFLCKFQPHFVGPTPLPAPVAASFIAAGDELYLPGVESSSGELGSSALFFHALRRSLSRSQSRRNERGWKERRTRERNERFSRASNQSEDKGARDLYASQPASGCGSLADDAG